MLVSAVGLVLSRLLHACFNLPSVGKAIRHHNVVFCRVARVAFASSVAHASSSRVYRWRGSTFDVMSTVVVPVVVSTVSFWLGKKADEYHSHQWTVNVRHPEGKSMKHLVDHVVFQLHPSFSDPERKVCEEPFELTETGWGEFHIGITLHFHAESGIQPAKIQHPLKLYPEGGENAQTHHKKYVIKEKYEEIVVVGATEAALKMCEGGFKENAPRSAIQEHFGEFSEEEQLKKLQDARLKVTYYTREIQKQMDSLSIPVKKEVKGR